MSALIRITRPSFGGKLLIPLFFILIALFLPNISFAKSDTPFASQSATPVSTYSQLPPTVYPTSPIYTDLMVHNLFHSFSCLAVGQSVIGQPCLTYQFTQNAQGALQGVPVLSQINTSGGVLGTTTNLIGALYANPPVRTVDYLASVGRGFGIAKTANAQVTGSGAQILNPILSLWKVSRNVSYVFLIIIFLVIGVMIMFRNKLNPQTVITAQTALPGLVIGLIMITFSYFFAGLISDMAFVGTNVVGYYFVSAQGQLGNPDFNKQLDLNNMLAQENIMGLMAPLTGIVTRERAVNVSDSIISELGDAINPLRIVVFWLTAQFMMPITGAIPPPWGLITGPILSLVSGVAANIALPNLLGYFLSFAAALALIYQMIKLLFKLIMAWLTIIFLTITAPFQFLVASMPGRQGMMTGWVLNMLGNILIFPAVIAVLYFVVFLTGRIDDGSHCPQIFKFRDKDTQKEVCSVSVSMNQNNQKSFISPVHADESATKDLTVNVVGSKTFPLLGGMDLDFVNILLAFGALMALPAIPDLVTKSIGKGGQAGAAIGSEIMGGFGKGQGYAKQTYMGGLNWAQGAKTSVFGEKTFTKVGTKWKPTMGKPGLRDKIDWS